MAHVLPASRPLPTTQPPPSQAQPIQQPGSSSGGGGGGGSSSSYKAAHVAPDTFSPVDQNGSFCFDRVLKRGKVQRRIKLKGVWKHSWRSAYLVLRPNLLSIYKNADETELRASIALSDITAVARVKKAHAQHVFAVFSPATNYHFQAASERDAADWVHEIRLEARPDDLDSLDLEPPDPAFGRRRKRAVSNLSSSHHHAAAAAGFDTTDLSADDSPGPPPASPGAPAWPVRGGRPTSSSRQHGSPPALHGYSANEHNTTSVSDLDFSDVQPGSVPKNAPLSPIASAPPPPQQQQHAPRSGAPRLVHRVQEQERVIRQGWLQMRTGGLRASWKSVWAVLRPRNLCLYKNEREYAAVRVIAMGAVIDAAEIESRHRPFCFQVIAEDKTYRLCAPGGEDALAKWLGSLKSVLSRYRVDTAADDGNSADDADADADHLDLRGPAQRQPPPQQQQSQTDRTLLPPPPPQSSLVEATRDLSLRPPSAG